MRSLPTACLLLAAALPLIAQEHTGHGRGAVVGHVHLAVATNPRAAAAFDRGIALLHSFEYDDAATAFREAEASDPALALAYYGEALTYRHILWREEDLKAAHAALEKLGPDRAARLGRTPSGRDRSVADAVEALYAPGKESLRADAFADSMRAAARRYPSEPELRAFTAIAILGDAYFYRDTAALRMRLEAAALAEGVLAANPEHPGAAHYIIHAYDTPALAGRGLAAAERYASIAPSAEHALHMPSHIFLQLGRWKDVERSNVAANNASRAWVAQHHVGAEKRDLHALDWLAYSLVQQGRLSEARAVLDTVGHLVAIGKFATDDLESVDLGEVIAMYLAWDGGVRSALDAPKPAAFARYAVPRPSAVNSAAMQAFLASSLRSAWRGDSVSASANARAFRAFADTNTVGAPRWYKVQATQLEALAAAARGDTLGAIGMLRQAANAERTLPVWSGPYWGVPAGELLGSMLLASGHARESADAFSDALQLRHGAAAPLLGRARARWAAGDHARAAEDYRELANNWHSADPSLPNLDEVRLRSRAPATK